ncbi:MAG: glycine cleavage system protein H [Candidatus Riflebacteria bacterium]|nr:glycine cleavage system protein H [Candidatus Riflebacteria bacterium]
MKPSKHGLQSPLAIGCLAAILLGFLFLLGAAPPWVVVALPAFGIVAMAGFLSASSSSVAGRAPSYKGLQAPPESFWLHPTHSWVRDDFQGEATVGLDDLLGRSLGRPDRVTLPKVGDSVECGQPLVTLQRGGRSVVVRAPLAGRVVRVNETLSGSTDLARRSPYDEGWCVRLAVPAPPGAAAGLLTGEAARDWFRAEVDRMLGLVVPEQSPSGAMADGGVLVADFADLLDDPLFDRIAAAFLGSGIEERAWTRDGLRRHGGETVWRGDYWRFDNALHVHVDGYTVLPGEATAVYYRLPIPLVATGGAVTGFLFRFLIPVIGLVAVFAVAVQALATFTGLTSRQAKSQNS